MTSSYGYQRPLSGEEELYLQNQALRAELQRRDQEKEGGFIDTLGKTALAAGVVAGAVLGGRRLLGGKNTSATFDLSKVGEKSADVRRIGATRAVPQEVVPASRPAPATSAERLQRIEQDTRQITEEFQRPRGVRQVDLSAEGGEYKSPYRAEPTERELYPSRYEYPAISKEVFEARRQQATQDLLNVVEQTKGAYQESIPGINPTLMAVRGAAREADELAGVVQPVAPSRPLSAAPEQIPLPLTSAIAKETNTVQAAAQGDFGPQQFLRDAGYVEAESLVDQQRLGAIGRIDQFANAANPAEDQATGRVKMALQRNEDINLAAIEMAEDAVDTQIAKAAQGDPTVASVTDLDSAINEVASTLPDGLPVDQAEAGRAFAMDVMQAQRERLEGRGFRGQQLERRLVFPKSVESAVEASLPVSAEDALTVGRAQPTQIAPGTSVQPASKTQLRGTTGRPELGVSGIEAGSTPQREVWGQGAIETERRILQGGENPVTRPVPFKYGVNLPEERTPEGYVYTKAAMTRPSKPGASRTPLVQPKTDVSRESVELSEQVRRIQREGGDVQAFLSEYKRGRI